jgi:hypothetical protein
MVESAPYEVLSTVDGIEVRAYPRLIVATVDGGGDDDSAFGHLFRYITGANKGSRSIAMTAPVITPESIAMTAPVINRGRAMSFVMPAGYTVDSIPEPTDPMVRIEELPARRMAVIRFKGRARERDVEAARERLLAALDKNSMQAVGAPVLMRYNSPFTPGFMRRNEVGVQVSD